MINNLVAELPTPLAVLLAGLLDELPVLSPKLFAICEIATQYVEYALRAQGDYRDGLTRPQSWGSRIQTIRRLSQTLRTNNVSPILHLDDVVHPLDTLVRLRNRWAHPGATSPEMPIPHAEMLGLLYHIFSPLCQAELIVVIPGDPEPTGRLLRGMRGLFSPPAVRLPDPIRPVANSELFLHRPPDIQVWLAPYLRYRTGHSGENIVEFLVVDRGGGFEYMNPLPRSSTPELQRS